MSKRTRKRTCEICGEKRLLVKSGECAECVDFNPIIPAAQFKHTCRYCHEPMEYNYFYHDRCVAKIEAKRGYIAEEAYNGGGSVIFHRAFT